jgi:SPP1 family predicted phage head-tail adaptor
MMSGRETAIGGRDRRIVIEAATDGVGPSHYPVETWTPLTTLWARFTPGVGDEQFTADQLSGTADDRWTIPYRADCDPDLVDVVKLRRIRRQARVYDIVGARPVERQGIELRTRAKVG